MADHPITAVELYWRPGCPFCTALRRRLNRSGIRFEAINIWEDPDGAARVRATAGGNETVPTVFIGGHGLVNPSLAQVRSLAREVAPQLLEQPGVQAKPRRTWWRR
ncbi:MAG: glutaredoxin domain-containing protein [Mycobacterium sp.]